jgi:predicted transposase YbfD/YdcC
MPQLVELPDLRDKIVPTDAMGCQKASAETIVAGGGDYILVVKGNQPTLHAEIQAAFATAATPPARSPRLYTTEDHGHGREQQRTVQVLPARGQLSAAQRAAWLGGLTIVMVTRVVWCEATGVESIEVSYFLSSLRPNARRIGTAIGGHWSIESGLPWV